MERPRFAPFGPDHVAALFLLGFAALALVGFGRRARAGTRRTVARILAGVLAGYAGAAYLRQGLAGALDRSVSLPLELCHWVMIAVIAALLRRSQLAAEIAYFWGLAGTLQATLTPDLAAAFPSWDFVEFFWGHGAVLLAIAHLIGVEGFEPRPGSPARMLAAVNVYALVVGAVDLVSGWNYGYLCRKPANPSLLDYLGPWPWYLASLELVAIVSFLLLDLPWRWRRRRAAPNTARSLR